MESVLGAFSIEKAGNVFIEELAVQRPQSALTHTLDPNLPLVNVWYRATKSMWRQHELMHSRTNEKPGAGGRASQCETEVA
jgi:hypothetical protein